MSVDGGSTKKGLSFAEVVSSSSEDFGSVKGARVKTQNKAKSLFGAKRPRSPGEMSCGRCFRTTHKTSECRHQVVCLRCGGGWTCRCETQVGASSES